MPRPPVRPGSLLLALVAASPALAGDAQELVRRYAGPGLTHTERQRMREELSRLGPAATAAVGAALQEGRLSSGRKAELVTVLADVDDPGRIHLLEGLLGFTLLRAGDLVDAPGLCRRLVGSREDPRLGRVWAALGEDGRRIVRRVAERGADGAVAAVARALRAAQRRTDLFDPALMELPAGPAAAALAPAFAQAEAGPRPRGAPVSFDDGRSLALLYALNRGLLADLLPGHLRPHRPLDPASLDPRVMGEALVTLARSGDAEALEVVLACDHVPRRYRTRALALVPELAALDPLLERLLDADPAASRGALRALVERAPREGLWLVEALLAARRDLEASAARGAAHTPDHYHELAVAVPDREQAARVLAETLASPTAAVRAAALAALDREPRLLAEPRVQEAVDELIAGGELDVAETLAVLRPLARSGATVYGPHLAAEYLMASDERLRLAAVDALLALTGQPLPRNPAVWHAWWWGVRPVEPAK